MKTLIIPDTNKLFYNSNDFSQFSFVGELLTLINHCKNKNLNVTFGFCEIVLKESLIHHAELYDSILNSYKKNEKEIKKIENISDNKVEINIDKDFLYEEFFWEEMLKMIEGDKNFIYIEFNKTKESLINIIQKKFKVEKPFKNRRGDDGFKDALITENILNSGKLCKFDNIIFYTNNTTDFAFDKITVESSYEKILSEIDSNLTNPIEKIRNNKYILGQIKEEISSLLEINPLQIDDIKIISINSYGSFANHKDTIFKNLIEINVKINIPNKNIKKNLKIHFDTNSNTILSIIGL